MVSEKREKWNPNEWCIFICEIFIFFSSSICIHQHYINEMINLKNEIIGMRMRYEIKWKKMEMNLTSFSCVFLLYFFMFISLFQSWTSSYFRDRSFGRNGWCSQIPLPIILSLSKRKHNVIPVVIRLCVFIIQIKSNDWNGMNEGNCHEILWYTEWHFIIIHQKKKKAPQSDWYQPTKWNCERWEC